MPLSNWAWAARSSARASCTAALTAISLVIGCATMMAARLLSWLITVALIIREPGGRMPNLPLWKVSTDPRLSLKWK